MSSKCFKVITQAHADQCKNLNLDKLDQIYQVWDAELSVVAQAHADQCKFAHDCSDCRRVSRFGVGQNLYIYKQVAYCYFFTSSKETPIVACFKEIIFLHFLQSLRKPDNNWEAGIRDW